MRFNSTFLRQLNEIPATWQATRGSRTVWSSRCRILPAACTGWLGRCRVGGTGNALVVEPVPPGWEVGADGGVGDGLRDARGVL